MAARLTRSRTGKQARAIEQIVRAQLLLLVLLLLGLSALLITEGGAVGLAAMVFPAVVLTAIGQLFARVPGRELVRLAQMAGVVLALAFFVLIGLVPKLGLYRPLTVLSGSMRPTFVPGDLIVVRPEPLRDVQVGQVISYYVPVAGHPLETHRIIRILRRTPTPVVQTQGDANNWHDPWTAVLHGGPAWKLSLVVPYAGYLINALRSHTLHLAAVLVAPVLFALILLAELWGLPALIARHTRSLGRRILPARSGHVHP